MCGNNCRKINPNMSAPDFKKIRFPHLRRPPGRRSLYTAGAEALGVSTSHLSRVVRGERTSPELLERFRHWRKQSAT